MATKYIPNPTGKRNNFITEISEEDFRKLDIKVHYYEKKEENKVWNYALTEMSFNDVLDAAIKSFLEFGYEEDLEALKYPITLALCVEDKYYLDKFLNMYTGPQDFQEGFGIDHIYVSRDYYEARNGDYWRVPKNITKAIYRIHLDEKWINSFKLKHKREIVKVIDDNTYIEASFDLVDDKWVEKSRAKIIKHEHSTETIPIKEGE